MVMPVQIRPHRHTCPRHTAVKNVIPIWEQLSPESQDKRLSEIRFSMMAVFFDLSLLFHGSPYAPTLEGEFHLMFFPAVPETGAPKL